MADHDLNLWRETTREGLHSLNLGDQGGTYEPPVIQATISATMPGPRPSLFVGNCAKVNISDTLPGQAGQCYIGQAKVVEVNGTLPGQAGRVVIAKASVVNVSAGLPGIRGGITLGYDNAVDRGPAAQRETGWQGGAISGLDSVPAAWEPSVPARTEGSISWEQAKKNDILLESRVRPLDRFRYPITDGWQTGRREESEPTGFWDQPARINIEQDHSWEPGEKFAVQPMAKWEIPGKFQRVDDHSWGEAAPLHREDRNTQGPAAIAGTSSVIVYWESASHPGCKGPPGEEQPPEERPPLTEFGLRLCRSANGNDFVLTLGGAHPCDGSQPPVEPTGIIPVQRTYIVIHNISVTRLSDGLPIDVESVDLSLDADAWSWGFSANLVGKNALTAVKPSVLGEPVTLAVTINDVTWHVIVEDWSENRSFANRSISVNGRGLTAELAAPYELPASGVTVQNWDVHQLMDNHLPLGSGWTVSWTDGLANWQVPAGAWSWQNQTPITAIHSIAQECGMVIVPDTDSRTLTVQPRYKFMPWAYSSETPDLTIPDSAVLSYQRQNSIPAQANAVYVHGEEVGGIVGHCVLDGTAGDKVLSTYNSKLITHTDGAYLVGSRLLAGQYKQPEVRSVTMTMGGAFPLGQIGQLVKLSLEAVDHYGIINSISLQANTSTVRQTITFGENTTNQWALFKTLIPGDLLLMGTVVNDSADGTVTAHLVDGAAIRVKGTAAIGTKVWMRSGRVEGVAPNLTQYPITIY